MLLSGNVFLFLKVNNVFVIGGCGLYFRPIVGRMHNQERMSLDHSLLA